MSVNNCVLFYMIVHVCLRLFFLVFQLMSMTQHIQKHFTFSSASSVPSSAAIRACLGLSALRVLLRFEFHATRGFHHSLRHGHGLLSISSECQLGHLQESLLDRCAVNCASLIKEHVIVLAGPLLASGRGHLSVGLLIQLVAQADEGEGLRVLRARILVEAVAPSGKRLKRLRVRDIIAERATVSTAVEGVAE